MAETCEFPVSPQLVSSYHTALLSFPSLALSCGHPPKRRLWQSFLPAGGKVVRNLFGAGAGAGGSSLPWLCSSGATSIWGWGCSCCISQRLWWH